MKLDVAAVNVDVNLDVVGHAKGELERHEKGSRSRGSVGTGWIAWAGALGLALGSMSAGSALALDGIDLSVAPEATAAGECARLIQIKYPFLKCQDGEIGLSDENATWANSRRIPIGSEFVEGNGYWGNSLNSDAND